METNGQKINASFQHSACDRQNTTMPCRLVNEKGYRSVTYF